VIKKQEQQRTFFKADWKVKQNDTAHTEVIKYVQYDLQKPKVKRWEKKSNNKD
jgi:hypothetical protein